MSCERYRKTLAGLAAGQPPAAEVDAHLAACAACRAELASLREGLALADATLREVVAHEPSPQLGARIARAVAGERAQAGASRPRPRLWAWAAAAGLLLAAVAWQWGWFQRSPAGRSSPGAPNVTPVTRVAAAAAAPSWPRPSQGGGPPVRQSAAGPEAARGRARNASSSPREPMVLVPAGEAEALEEFAAELQQRTVDPGSLLVADPMRALPEAEPLQIQPLEIAPLAGADRS